MPSIETLVAFFGVSVLLGLSPGPDNLFVLMQSAQRGWRETAWLLLLPPVVTAAMTLASALFADASISPLAWARLIAAREYVGLEAP